MTQPFLTPEVVPSSDEISNQPEIGPNIAESVDAEKITRYLIGEYWIPYEIQQQRLWNVWRQLYEAWCAKCQIIDLDIPPEQYSVTQQQGLVAANPRDGFTLKISPTDLHRQWDALLKIFLQIAFEGGGIPVAATQKANVFETFYNPTGNTVEAANEILADTADEVNLWQEARKNFHQFLVYGHCWASTDPRRSFMDVEARYALGADMTQAQIALSMLLQQKGPPARIDDSINGKVAVYPERRIKELYTRFRHLDKSDVFTDLTLSCCDMDKHPCPFVREVIGEHAIEQNNYDPEKNPFGWLNIRKALDDAKGQYILTMEDEAPRRQQLLHRYGINDQTTMRSEHTPKQLWTAYPMLRMADDGTIDMGDGVKCPHCFGRGKMMAQLPTGAITESVDCQLCAGSGRTHPPLKRYVAQWYGNPRVQGMTLIRLQEMPDGMKVPLRFAADMIEDTACAIPTAKGEVAMNDFYVKAECDGLFLQSKRLAILRGWKVKDDSPANSVDLMKPGQKIPFESSPDEAVRIDSSTIDETITIAPYVAEREQRIKDVLGATDQVLGQLAQGRRSALELSNAIDASKNPIIVTIDGYNRQMMKGWAEDTIQNMDLWGDRDFIRRKTGREYFGRVRFKTSVAEEYVRKLGRIQNQRTILEMLPSMLPVMPQLIPVATKIMQKWLDDQGMGDVRIPDDGLLKAQQMAMRLVSKIMGDGQVTFPSPDDNHIVFIDVFKGAIEACQNDPDDPFFGQLQNLPLLQQRLLQQQQLFQFQQQQMLQAQMAMQAAQQPNRGPSAPKDESKPTPGGQMQSIQGPAGEQAA